MLDERKNKMKNKTSLKSESFQGSTHSSYGYMESGSKEFTIHKTV